MKDLTRAQALVLPQAGAAHALAAAGTWAGTATVEGTAKGTEGSRWVTPAPQAELRWVKPAAGQGQAALPEAGPKAAQAQALLQCYPQQALKAAPALRW